MWIIEQTILLLKDAIKGRKDLISDILLEDGAFHM